MSDGADKSPQRGIKKTETNMKLSRGGRVKMYIHKQDNHIHYTCTSLRLGVTNQVVMRQSKAGYNNYYRG